MQIVGIPNSWHLTTGVHAPGLSALRSKNKCVALCEHENTKINPTHLRKYTWLYWCIPIWIEKTELIHASWLHLASCLLPIPSIVVLHPSFELAHFDVYCYFTSVHFNISEPEHCYSAWLKPAARTWAAKGFRGTREIYHMGHRGVLTNKQHTLVYQDTWEISIIQYKQYKHMVFNSVSKGLPSNIWPVRSYTPM